MSGIAAQIAAMSEEKRIFTLSAYPETQATAEKGGRLGRLLIDPGWLEAQRGFDPSLQTYLRGLDVAIRSVEAGQAGERGLLLLMVLSLLASTARAILGELPDEALEVMSQDGRIEQARYVAGQRPTPWERSQALLVVARVEVGLGRRTGAAETLGLARQEAMAIADPASRCRSLLALLQVEDVNTPDRGRFAAQLGQLCDLAESITDLRLKTHVQAELAVAAETAGLTDLHNRSAAGIRKAYLAARESLEGRRLAHEHRVRDKTPFWYKSTVAAEPLDRPVNLIGELGLWDRPAYLVAIARADAAAFAAARASPFPSSLTWAEPARIVAPVLSAAASQGDRATCERIVSMVLNLAAEPVRLSAFTGPGAMTELVEAFAEAGYGDAALALIAQRLAESADVADLRKALARGGGRRGDLRCIEAAAGPIAAAGRPATLRDRLERAAAGAKQGLEIAGAGWLLGAGVSGAEVTKIEIYLEGYRGLLEHDAGQAEAFLAALSQRAGPAGERLIRRILAAGPGGLDDVVEARLNKLMSAVERLPGSHLAVDADDRVGLWLACGDFDRALAVVAEVKDPDQRARLLYQIALELLKAGQLERGLGMAETLPASIERRGLFQEAMVHLAAQPEGEALVVTDRITAGLGKLTDADRLAQSPALPALAAALAAHVPLPEARGLLEPLGLEALVATCEPLAAAVAHINDPQKSIETAGALLAWIEKQAPSASRIRAACALVRAWAPKTRLAAVARRAYEIALDDARRLDFTTPPRFDLPFAEGSKRRQAETSPLAELAMAGRALRDRTVLLDLWSQAQRIAAKRPRGTEDNALVDIAAGLAGVGEILRYDDFDSFPPLQAMGREYKPLAQLEMAAAMVDLPPEEVYRARKRRVLSAPQDRITGKLVVGSGQEPAGSWQSHKARWAAEELGSMREGLVQCAIRNLPEMPKATAKTGHKKGSAGPPSPAPALESLANIKPSPLFTSSSLLSSRAKGDARLWSRMVASLAGQQVYAAIPRVVLAAQGSLRAGGGGGIGPLESPSGITQEELDAIVDSAMAALLAAGQVALAQQLAGILPEPVAAVEARLAATAGSPQEAERILSNILRQAWNPITLAAVASTAAGQPSGAARQALAVQILQKARVYQRRGVLQALGAMIPLAGSMLNPADLSDALGRIIASEGYW